MDEVIRQFEEIVIEGFDNLKDLPNWERTFDDEYYLNLFQFMRILSNAEKYFGIEFDDESLDIDRYRTLNDIKAVVVRLYREKNRAI